MHFEDALNYITELAFWIKLQMGKQILNFYVADCRDYILTNDVISYELNTEQEQYKDQYTTSMIFFFILSI